jgi:hypothetical protein
MFKEILTHVQHRSTGDGFAEFLDEFTLDGVLRAFTRIDPSSGQRPAIISDPAMQQQVVALSDHGCHPVMEANTIDRG